MAIPQYSTATAAHFVGRELGASDWVAVDQDVWVNYYCSSGPVC